MSIQTYEPTDGGSLGVITGDHVRAFQDWAMVLAKSALLPEALRGKPADVFMTIAHGLDLGLKPMQAINLIYVVKGRPSLSAEGMRALLLRDGHDFRIAHLDQDRCVVEGRRRGTDVWVSAEFTDAQRKAAKLAGQNWDAYREDMLLARATTRLCKRFFGDVIGGLSGYEDILDEAAWAEAKPTLADVAAERGERPANVDDHGVIDAQLIDDGKRDEDIRAAVADIEAQHLDTTADTRDDTAREADELFAGIDS